MPFWIENLIILGGVSLVILSVIRFGNDERWARARHRFKSDRMGKLALTIILVFAFIGVLDSIQLSTKTPKGQRFTVLEYFFRDVPVERTYSAPLASQTYSINRAQPLKGRHWLGTDVFGKDVLLHTLKGCRTALIIGGLTSIIYIPLGTLMGLLAGYYRKWVDDLIQYVYTTLSSIPEILFLISLLLILGKGIFQISFALGITSWVGLCRLIRGETMRQTEKSYIEAAQSLGQSDVQIISRHLLPNVMHLVFINFVLGFSGLVLAEAILSYLGVGVPIGTASWGLMIDASRMELAREPAVWWNLASASGALFILVLSLNLLGDSLRRAFNPRSS